MPPQRVFGEGEGRLEHAHWHSSVSSLSVQVWYELALQTSDLIFEQELALFQSPQLHLVDIQIHLQSVDHIVQVAMFDA